VSSSSRARALLAAFAAALFAANAASAHGDPSTHMLESENLYPAVASRPTQSLELRLIGLLRAAAARGYPIKIALIAGADDLEDASMLGRPQAYAEYVQGELGGTSTLRAPLVVIGPSGFGVSGRELRNGRLRSIRGATAWPPLRGLSVPPGADGDALARTALAVVRRATTAAGRPLPAEVAPATYIAATPARTGGSGIVLPLVLGVSFFVLAWLGYELWASSSTRRTEPRRRSAERPRPSGP
jgi:hypothetical protein